MMTTAGKARRTDFVAVLAAMLAAAVLVSVLPPSVEGAAGPASAAPRVQVMVRFAEHVAPAQRRAAVRRAGGVVTDDLHLIDGLGARLPTAAVPRLQSMTGVHSVSPVAAVASRAASMTPVYGATIGAERLRTERQLSGRGVTVAVIDSGIEKHKDLGGRVHSVVVNDDAGGAGDDYGHGTHVAGIIAGDGAKTGYLGVAPEAELLSIKIADRDGLATTLDAVKGIQYAVDRADRLGIRVINLSLASTQAQSPRTDPLAAAAEVAWMHGIVVVAAAGNDGKADSAVSYAPANDPYVITVGATDDRGTADPSDDVVAPWSSRGTTQTGVAKPEVLAPGTGIVSTLAKGSDFTRLCEECVIDKTYFRASGTSMAAAVVSGAAALVLQAHPDWTPDQVKAALMRTSSPYLRADLAAGTAPDAGRSAQSHRLSSLLNPDSPEIDFDAASWRAASWRAASWRVFF